MARMVNCVKLKKEAEGLDFPPYPGELGKRLWESVSKEAWKGWLEHQKMLVNENRLNLSDQRARKYLEEQMRKHFFGRARTPPRATSPRPENYFGRSNVLTASPVASRRMSAGRRAKMPLVTRRESC